MAAVFEGPAPQLSAQERMSIFYSRSKSPVPAVIDSDAYNEIDDQFAIAWALLRPDRIDVQAIYAAPFSNSFFGKQENFPYIDDPTEGMRLSFAEITRVLELLPPRYSRANVLQGSTRYVKNSDTPEQSPAALDLIERARSSRDVLRVIAIGAPTNIANALLLAPDIIKNIHVIWLGGNSYEWHNNQEFNLMQDIAASRILFDSGAALTQVPCFGVANCMASSVPEIQHYLTNTSRIGNYLAGISTRLPWIGFASRKVIWDIAPVGYALNRDWFTTRLASAPLINDNLNWSFDNRRHLIEVVQFIERDELFQDAFRKIMDADNG